ncbi:MAG: carbamoyltransferase family protein [Candidatus Binatia bacterium]
MRILGISDHIISGAALLEDGVVTAAINEERLARKKMVMGFPRRSIQTVLELAKLRPEQVDYVAVASKRGHFLNDYVDFDAGAFSISRGVVKEMFMSLGSRLSVLRDDIPVLERLYYDLREPVYAHRRKAVRKVLKEEFDIRAPVEFIEHHFAHACSTFYSSGYQDALVVTMDASGDGSSSHVYQVKNKKWQLLHRVPSFDSLASYYAYVTHICGFRAGKHEGKITGLAAYGKDSYRDIVEKFICYRDGTVINRGKLFYKSALKKIRQALPLDFSKKDLAATIQLIAEEIATRYIFHWLEKTKEHNVGLAGGLFANVKINQRVHEIPGVRSVFVHPAMSDEGLAVGASLALNYVKAPDPTAIGTRCFDHVYLGPSFTEAQVQRLLAVEGVKYQQHRWVEEEIARLLAEGYVVARFAGRMEYGPRALGNRSILYRPDDPSVNDWLNRNLKRTEFMPFAPSTLADDADKSFIGLEGAREAARYMTITFNCTERMRRECDGVVHVDNTARPQIVNKADNPDYYRILESFKRQTGISSIINTSFNIHEEPIVCTPEDAWRAFKIGRLDFLALGSFIAEHPQARIRERTSALHSSLS